MFIALADPEDDPEYYEAVRTPMDLATILSRVDARRYDSTEKYLADVRLVELSTRQYYGCGGGTVGADGSAAADTAEAVASAAALDGNGSRDISLASALYDEAEELLKGRLHLPGGSSGGETLWQRLWRMREAGGPAPPPAGTVTVEALAAEALEQAAAAASVRGGGDATARVSGRHKGDTEPIYVSER